MTLRFGRFGTALVVFAILQTLVLGWIVANRIALLRSPDTVTLATEPIDPRDLFRGDYVTLAYSISRLRLDVLRGDKGFRQGDTIYIEIAPTGATWTAVAAWRAYPHPASGDKVIRGRIKNISKNVRLPRTVPGSSVARQEPCPDCVLAAVAYGIESYFVSEGQGKGFEAARNARSLAVDVALSDNGEAAIKALRLDGQLLYEEPLL